MSRSDKEKEMDYKTLPPAARMTNRRRIEKRLLGLHGKRKKQYREAGLTGEGGKRK